MFFHALKKHVRQASNQPNNKHRTLTCAMISMLLFVTLTACSKSNIIETIEISNSIITMDIEQEETVSFKVTPEDANVESLEVICDNGITAQIKDSELIITSEKQEGTYHVVLSNDEITSNTLTIEVEDITKKIAAEKAEREAEEKAEKEKAAKEKAAAAKAAKEEAAREKAAEEKQEQSKSSSNQSSSKQSGSSSSGSYSGNNNTTNSAKVYIASSGNGTKYHSNPNCSRMNGTYYISIDDALARGYSACKKCY